MKYFSQMLKEQKETVNSLRSIASEFVDKTILSNEKILGALLTGSVARGDARIAPMGICIDIAFILNKKSEINLDELFGKNEKPFLPYYHVHVKDNVWIALQIIEENQLWKIREFWESHIFAMKEGIILYDKCQNLKKWKETEFEIDSNQIKERALQNYFRFGYLIGEYRIEKWTYREAWVQIVQNFNEANECYCNFLYCINGFFIPRKDWLTYLTYEFSEKPEDHTEYLELLYENSLNKDFLLNKSQLYVNIQDWMKNYCIEKKWLEG